MDSTDTDARRRRTSTGNSADLLGGSFPLSAANNGSARSLLLTVLGEFVLPYSGSVWTSALLNLMCGLGLEEHTVRQAMARAASAGWVESRKTGRRVRWEITEFGAEVIEEHRRRSTSPAAVTRPWDGQWLILVVTVRQRHRQLRKPLYDALAGVGCGNPTPGTWISPHTDRMAEIQRIVNDLGLRESSIGFVGPALAVGLSPDEMVRRGWQLDQAAGHYENFVRRVSGIAPVTDEETLLSYVGLINAWQQIPFIDPELPVELLPEWVGRLAASLFAGRRDSWSGPAHRYWLSAWAD